MRLRFASKTVTISFAVVLIVIFTILLPLTTVGFAEQLINLKGGAL